MDKLKAAGMIASGQTSPININGSEEKTAWSELAKKYPGKWVIYTDLEIVKDDRLFLCKVLEVCDDNSRNERKLYYIRNGIRAMAMRTTSDFNGSMGDYFCVKY